MSEERFHRKYGEFEEYAGTIRCKLFFYVPEDDVSINTDGEYVSHELRYACLECGRIYLSWEQANGCSCLENAPSLDRISSDNIMEGSMEKLREQTNEEIELVEKEIEELREENLSESKEKELDKIERRLENQKTTMSVINQLHEEDQE